MLLPVGVWLLAGSQRLPREREITTRLRFWVWMLAFVVGVVGGIYGIGGGSLLAFILIALGFSMYEVAPAPSCSCAARLMATRPARSGPP